MIHLSNYNVQFWNPFLEALVWCFSREGKMNELIKYLIKKEVAFTKNISTLFREDSLSIRVVNHYFRELGSSFLNKVVAPKISKILKGQQKEGDELALSLLRDINKSIHEIPK